MSPVRQTTGVPFGLVGRGKRRATISVRVGVFVHHLPQRNLLATVLLILLDVRGFCCRVLTSFRKAVVNFRRMARRLANRSWAEVAFSLFTTILSLSTFAKPIPLLQHGYTVHWTQCAREGRATASATCPLWGGGLPSSQVVTVGGTSTGSDYSASHFGPRV